MTPVRRRAGLAPRPVAQLSGRELEVLKLLAAREHS
jgi:DNA-binding CsgD family transcriptional regulator